ncbi:MAG: 4-hydroxythreonine-4-phosphate dehydrogenase PdxA [Candidatus Palauibacterales bacterium]|nr:4-hydroxythreonine-4-phosphate dehydrogenase PdxA [Candidatus Palauibacterales bacterium]
MPPEDESSTDGTRAARHGDDTDGPRPRIAITVGDPRGIGHEVVGSALASPSVRRLADFHLLGPGGLLETPREREREVGEITVEDVESWDPATGGDPEAGRVAGAAVERALELAQAGEVDGLVTAPVAKDALFAAGYEYPGHTEMLRDRTAASEVTMMMAAESTPLPQPLDHPLRMALVTGHVAFRDVPDQLTVERTVRRSRLAVDALRDWWGVEEPRLAFAGLNPHASEGGLFGDEEERVLEPAMARVADLEGVEVTGVFPADTVFRTSLRGEVDAVVVPYHDVGLAVIKTLALEHGVNVTAGLPFPRTSPDHGTAFDIAGTGDADPRSMIAAIRLCARFCRTARREVEVT